MQHTRTITLSESCVNILDEVKRIFINESKVPIPARVAENMGLSRYTVAYHYERLLDYGILIRVGHGKYRFSRRPYTIDVLN